MANKPFSSNERASSLIFGSAPYTANDPCPLRAANSKFRSADKPMPLHANHCAAAGISRDQRPDQRVTAEMAGRRRQRAPKQDIHRMYDDYIVHTEDQAFERLRTSLGRLERRAEREHAMYTGAAGCSNEKRQEKAESRGYNRRAPSPHRQRSTESVAALIQPACPDRA